LRCLGRSKLSQIWVWFAWPCTSSAGLLCSPLVLPWPAYRCPQTQPPRGQLFPAPPSPHHRRFVAAIDAGHRRRDGNRRCGSIGRSLAASPVLSQPRCSVRGRRRRCWSPLSVASPPAIISFTVDERGELSCTVLPDRKSAEATLACRSVRRHWIAPTRYSMKWVN
jgi:hypothetical protein